MRLSIHKQADPEDKQKKTVILLHGLLGRARNLGMLQRALSPFFNTIAFDLRSHGDSPHGLLDYHVMAKDVLETMDQLNISKASLIGHSMGGKVAMAVALTAPERVNKLCVADISPAQALHGSKEIIQTISSLLLPSLKTRTEIRQFLVSVLGKEDMADLVGQNINPGDPAYWTIGLKEITQSLNIIENWPESFFAHQWNGPTLFLRGELSPYIQPKHHPLIHKLFPKADIVTLPGTNHWLHVEKPDEFNSLVLDFLKNHSES